MSRVNNPLLILLAGASAFAMDNPELVDFMNSPEEQERMDQMFEDMARQANEEKEQE